MCRNGAAPHTEWQGPVYCKYFEQRVSIRDGGIPGTSGREIQEPYVVPVLVLVSRPTCAHDKVHVGISSVQLEIIPPRVYRGTSTAEENYTCPDDKRGVLALAGTRRGQSVLTFRERSDSFCKGIGRSRTPPLESFRTIARCMFRQQTAGETVDHLVVCSILVGR